MTTQRVWHVSNPEKNHNISQKLVQIENEKDLNDTPLK